MILIQIGLLQTSDIHLEYKPRVILLCHFNTPATQTEGAIHQYLCVDGSLAEIYVFCLLFSLPSSTRSLSQCLAKLLPFEQTTEKRCQIAVVASGEPLLLLPVAFGAVMSVSNGSTGLTGPDMDKKGWIARLNEYSHDAIIVKMNEGILLTLLFAVSGGGPVHTKVQRPRGHQQL